jgi:putative ABC transport system substrate-binding protein
VELGLAQSLARPGGNVTGMAWWTGPELVTKQLEFLKEIAPKTGRLAWITPTTVPEDVAGRRVVLGLPALESAARTLGMELHRFPVRQPEDFDAVFLRVLELRLDAVGLAGDLLTFAARKRIVEFANRNGLPSTYGMKDFVVAGGLLSYSADTGETFRKSATYVGRILKGSKPADLPIEQPTKFELIINMKTAKALGLTIPPSLLLRADLVIE